MAPEIFRGFVAGFTAGWNCLQAEASAARASRQQELDRVDYQLNKLFDALIERVPTTMVKDRMAGLEARKAVASGVGLTEVPAPRLHPGLAQIYHDRVAELTRL